VVSESAKECIYTCNKKYDEGSVERTPIVPTGRQDRVNMERNDKG